MGEVDGYSLLKNKTGKIIKDSSGELKLKTDAIENNYCNCHPETCNCSPVKLTTVYLNIHKDFI